MKSEDLIGQSFRAGAGRASIACAGKIEETERAEPVIDGDDHRVARRQHLAVIDALAAGTDHERAAVNPDHHGPLGIVASRRPHIQEQAIFRLLAHRAAHQHFELGRRLRADMAEFGGVAHAGPGFGRFGHAPAQRAHRRFCEGDTLEARDAVLAQARQFARWPSRRFRRLPSSWPCRPTNRARTQEDRPY